MDVGTDNNIYVDQSATGQFMIHQFKDNASNKNKASLYWKGKTTLSPVSSTVYLQIYNQITTTWQTVDSDNQSDPDVEFVLEAEINGLENYKNVGNFISCRVYQEAT